MKKIIGLGHGGGSFGSSGGGFSSGGVSTGNRSSSRGYMNTGGRYYSDYETSNYPVGRGMWIAPLAIIGSYGFRRYKRNKVERKRKDVLFAAMPGTKQQKKRIMCNSRKYLSDHSKCLGS